MATSKRITNEIRRTWTDLYQKTNSIFDGEKLTINLVKSSNNLYSNLILIPNSDGRLSAQSADTPLLTKKSSTLNRDTSTWIAYKEIRSPEIKETNKNKTIYPIQW